MATMDSYIYDPERAERINKDALSLLLDMLQEYENQITPKHEAVLSALIRGFTDIYFNRLTGDYVAPLFTGGGKTTAIIAWLAALNKHRGKDHIPVIVSAAKVEAICQLKKDLVARGIVAEDIYLKHGEIGASEDSNVGVPQGGVLVILVTHTKLIPRHIGNGILKGTKNKKQLIIYDESYLRNESITLDWDELHKELENKHLEDSTHRVIREYISLISEGKSKHPRGISFKRGYTYGFEDIRIKLADLSEQPLRVYHDERNHLIQGIYKKPIPKTSIISLDASYPVRKLLHWDNKLKNLFSKRGYKASYKNAKDYSQLQLNLIKHETTATALRRINKQGEDSLIIQELKHLLSLIPSEEAVLIFTLKKIKPHIEALLKAETKLTLPDGKQRINFITWGKETSLNDFAHCKNVILVGVWNKPSHVYSGQYLAQLGDITKEASFDIEDDMRQSERLHLIYQALSRGSSRKTVNGFAEPMRAFILHDKTITGLEQVFPNAPYKKFDPLGYDPKNTEAAITLSPETDNEKQEDERIYFDKILMLDKRSLKAVKAVLEDVVEQRQSGKQRRHDEKLDVHLSCLVANLIEAIRHC
jgi:hypothetical protein